MEQVFISRLSGVIQVTGTMDYNTSNVSSGWTSQRTGVGRTRITFGGKSFTKAPNVLVNVLYTEAELPNSTVNIGILPTSEYIDIELWQENKGLVDLSISFAAFGIFND